MVIICADERILNTVNYLAKNYPNNLPDLFAYDTTFCLGNFYLSYLVSRNQHFDNNPVFPVAFMIHEKKHVDVHSEFWKFISKTLHIDTVVIDREEAITLAIKTECPNIRITYCYNHLLGAVGRFVSKNITTDKVFNASIKDDIHMLTECTVLQEYQEMCEKYYKSWPTIFVTYYNQYN
jgi:MULE transposase domain